MRIAHSGPEAGKFVLTIEGDGFVASVCVWENGCCDFDLLKLATKQGLSWHYEFCCLEDALRCVAQDMPLQDGRTASQEPRLTDVSREVQCMYREDSAGQHGELPRNSHSEATDRPDRLGR